MTDECRDCVNNQSPAGFCYRMGIAEANNIQKCEFHGKDLQMMSNFKELLRRVFRGMDSHLEALDNSEGGGK